MVIGLTGGICSGKSLATAVAVSAGFHVIDCDDLARFFTDCEPPVRSAIREAFGPEVFHPAGAMLRRKLGELIFADEAQRRRLEQILHPHILDCVERNALAARASNAHLIVVAPLLFELGMQSLFDATWLVACDSRVQLERLMLRNQLAADEARRWIAAQWPRERKEPLASRVLVNDATIADFESVVLSALEGVSR